MHADLLSVTGAAPWYKEKNLMDPWVKNPQLALNPGPFDEGDRVLLRWGVTPVEALIIEDRGNLGVDGRRLYRVRIRLDEFTDPIETTYPADELSLVAKAPITPRTKRQG